MNTVNDAASGQSPILATFLRHSSAEADLDLDATMATFAANPRWELQPLDVRITGAAAIYEFYRRTLPYLFDHLVSARQVSLYEGVDHLVTEYEIDFTPAEGAVCRTKLLALFTFSGSQVQSETAYTDDAYARLYELALGEDFFDLPGVERRGEV